MFSQPDEFEANIPADLTGTTAGYAFGIVDERNLVGPVPAAEAEQPWIAARRWAAMEYSDICRASIPRFLQ